MLISGITPRLNMGRKSHSLNLRGKLSTRFYSAHLCDEQTVCAEISTSKFAARAEIEPIPLDAFADVEVMDPARD